MKNSLYLEPSCKRVVSESLKEGCQKPQRLHQGCRRPQWPHQLKQVESWRSLVQAAGSKWDLLAPTVAPLPPAAAPVNYLTNFQKFDCLSQLHLRQGLLFLLWYDLKDYNLKRFFLEEVIFLDMSKMTRVRGRLKLHGQDEVGRQTLKFKFLSTSMQLLNDS